MAKVDQERFGRRAHERRMDRRPLLLKIRVRVRRAMSKAELIRRLETSIEAGVMDDLLDVAYVDWEKGRGAKVNHGRAFPKFPYEDLAVFLGAIRAAEVRAERV